MGWGRWQTSGWFRKVSAWPVVAILGSTELLSPERIHHYSRCVHNGVLELILNRFWFKLPVDTQKRFRQDWFWRWLWQVWYCRIKLVMLCGEGSWTRIDSAWPKHVHKWSIRGRVAGHANPCTMVYALVPLLQLCLSQVPDKNGHIPGGRGLSSLGWVWGQERTFNCRFIWLPLYFNHY